MMKLLGNSVKVTLYVIRYKNMITEHASFRLIFGIDKWVLSNAKIP